MKRGTPRKWRQTGEIVESLGYSLMRCCFSCFLLSFCSLAHACQSFSAYLNIILVRRDLSKRPVVCVKPRRPPMTNAGTKTAFRHDHVQAAPESDTHFNSCSTEGERRNLKQEEVGFTRRRRELNKMVTVALVTMTTIA